MQGNFYQALFNSFSQRLDSPALLLSDSSDWTYGDLDHQSARLAQLLLAEAEPGDRVLVQVDKSPAAVALYLACLRAGLVMVPLNTAYTASELDYFISDADPAMVICRDEDSARISDQAPCPVSGLTALFDASPATAIESSIAARSATDPAAIVYTSGTTGRSKGAVLSHANLASNAAALREAWGFSDADVLLHALPIFHVHGLFIALNTALLSGAPILFLERFETSAVLAALPRATVMMGVPTFYTRLLASPDFGPAHYQHIRVFICGSAPLTEQTFEEFERRTGQRILERYGMSETGIISSNPLAGERLAGSVGFALGGSQIRVCDELGQPLPAGEVGIVETRGPNVFPGYWQMPEKTAAEFRDGGWFITGDMGTLDQEGRLQLVGREKDLIISGGYNVYPKEVELALDEIAGIAESAVIGVPHADFGEAVVAVCVLDDGAAAPQQASIDEHLKEKLARFKQPKAIVTLAELPRNAMGKVQKNQLRERYAQLFAGPA